MRSELLTERKVKTQYGLVVDKLTQRLYLFHDGGLMDTLAVSTGLADADHPWNETRSGEYVLSSPSGAFPSEKLMCNYGIRYNDGDLIHEVPHVVTASGKNYGYTEPKLGSKASHGCIRVQRRRTPNGVNMRWLWNRLKDQIAIPEASLTLYYNPIGGENDHSAETCYGVRDQYLPLTAFTYGELEEAPFGALTACASCNPAMRAGEIEAVNGKYAGPSGEKTDRHKE